MFRDAERTLSEALEAVRQDMLIVGMLDDLSARLDALPALPAGDPLLSMGCATTEMHKGALTHEAIGSPGLVGSHDRISSEGCLLAPGCAARSHGRRPAAVHGVRHNRTALGRASALGLFGILGLVKTHRLGPAGGSLRALGRAACLPVR